MNDMKSWPFSSYDFFGYLMPGFIFLLSLFGWFKYAEFDFLKNVVMPFKGGINIGNSLLILFFVFSLSYFIGHLIGAVSHILYDRMLIRSCIGYPIHYILNTGKTPSLFTRTLYLIGILIFCFILILPGLFELCYLFWNSDLYQLNVCSEDGILYLGMSCAIPQEYNISIFSSVIFVILAFFILFLINIRLRILCKTEKQKKNFPNWMIDASHFLKENVFYPIRKLTATDTLVNYSVRQKFNRRLKREFDVSGWSKGSDSFWLASMRLAKNKEIDSKLMNWLNLYGCLRNYSCAFALLAIIIASNHWYLIVFNHQMTGLKGSRILLASLIISFVLFLRYWIIYFSYYSKYLIRAYAYLSKVK